MYLAHSAKGEIAAQPYQVHVCNVYEMALGNAARAGAYSQYGTLMKDAVAFAAYYHDLGKFVSDLENKFPHCRVLNLSADPVAGGVSGGERLNFRMDMVALVKPNS